MNRANRRAVERANAQEQQRKEMNALKNLEIKKPVLMGNCFECGRQLYSNDKNVSIHGRYFCDHETVTQLVLKLEERIINYEPVSASG